MSTTKTIKGTKFSISLAAPSSAKKLKATYKNPKTGREKSILFGAKGYSHFRDASGLLPKSQEHHDQERRRRYVERHKANENWNKPSAGMLSRYILW